MNQALSRRAVAEGVGTAFLLAAIVGSGIMATRMSAGSEAIALLANSLATGGALLAIILALVEFSGAHLNPLVTLARFVRRESSGRETVAYVVAQCVGAVAGVVAAHAMFGAPLVSFSTKARAGFGLGLGEVVASFGLVSVVLLVPARRAAFAVAAYVVAGYWFTSSTCFANPAVTLARSLTDTFTGIRPGDVPGFLLGQAAGSVLALVVAGRGRGESA